MRKWIDLLESVEADGETIFEIVDSFAVDIEGRGLANEVYAEDKGAFTHLFIGGYPEDGFSEEVARGYAAELNSRVRPHGWFVAKCNFDYHRADEDDDAGSPQIMCFVDIFPLFGSPEEPYRVMFHACRAQDVEQIKQHGLEPRTGGTDHIQTENGRVYALIHEKGLATLAYDMMRLRGWRDLHVFAIHTQGLSNKWYVDVEMPDASLWTPETIPASALEYLGPIQDVIAHVNQYGALYK